MKFLPVILLMFVSACSIQAPPYNPSIENLQTLKRSSIEPINVGGFSDSKKVNNLSIRGSSYNSPFEKSFGKYFQAALVSELKLAKLWDGVSDTVIEGDLLENEVSGSGEANITVLFKVTRKGKTVFEKKLSAEHEWESSFVGAIAIPAAANNYPKVISKVIGKLFNDRDFISVTKK